MPIAARTASRGSVGDEILVASSGHSSSSPDRRGEIIGVVGEHYRVRWTDGRETVLHPAAGASTPKPAISRLRGERSGAGVEPTQRRVTPPHRF